MTLEQMIDNSYPTLSRKDRLQIIRFYEPWRGVIEGTEPETKGRTMSDVPHPQVHEIMKKLLRGD